MPTPPASAGSDKPGGERRVPLLVVLAGMGAAIALAALVGHPSAGPGPPPRVDAVPLAAPRPPAGGAAPAPGVPPPPPGPPRPAGGGFEPRARARPPRPAAARPAAPPP